MPAATTIPTIVDSTASYESWLRAHTTVVEGDLKRKHRKMEESPFVFMRATFYRWVETFPQDCPDLIDAPQVLAVGDLHVNNFGLWRDAEGRLAWGVNDFDEAHQLPYTNDLVRLALSAALIDEQGDLDVCLKDACEAILKSYRSWLRKGGRALVLAERNDFIRDLAVDRLVHPERFWAKLENLPSLPAEVVPAGAREALESLLPEPGLPHRLARRVAGAGSLGRPRFVAIGQWAGGNVAREAKAIVPSACAWGDGTDPGQKYDELLARAVRSRDPWVARHGDWIVRRLAPDSIRIELESLPDEERVQTKLLKAMGREAANVHLASRDVAPAVVEDLDSRPKDWLQSAAKSMLTRVLRDWRDWRKRKPPARPLRQKRS